MQKRAWAFTVAFAVATCLIPSVSSAQLYAGDSDCGCIYSYQDTFATIVSPQLLVINQIGGLSLDHQGNILIAGYFTPSVYAARLDPDTEEFDLLFPEASIPGYAPIGVVPDQGDDIYLLMQWAGSTGIERDSPAPDDFIALLAGGENPASVAYVVPNGYSVIDMKVRPRGASKGNVIVMCEDTLGGGHLFVELERTAGDTFAFVQSIADGGMMPSNPRAFAFSPDGTITLVDYNDGLFYVDEEYNYVWGFGTPTGPGLNDITIDSDGYIYLANLLVDRVRRYTNAGAPAGPVFGSDLVTLRAITVAGYTPTPVGDNVLVEPWENVEVTFEGITQAGFTTAVVETSSSRVSSAGNYLPEYAALPGSRADAFTYVSLATDAVYTDVMQVDVLLEGSRLFFASGYGDTFRDFTVVGSIEDAQGTIPRFSEQPNPNPKRAESDPTEVVLVEDSRELSEVTRYKFRRLALSMAIPDTTPFCPWGAIYDLRNYRITARTYYDLGEYSSAIAQLAAMNEALRGYAGWCVPNSSAAPLNNRVGRILGHSKTLMFSIELESQAGVDELPSTISLSVVSPARGECSMAITGPAGAEVTVRLYDVSGRLVATVYEGMLPEGGASVVWDGVDSSGHRAASGVYFARAEAEGQQASSKVVYLR